MESRRFSLHRRKGIYYVQFWNPETGKYTTAKSTKVPTKNEATGIVMRWLNDGIPFADSRRTLRQSLQVDTIFNAIRIADLTATEAERIVEILKERELLNASTAADKGEKLISFLTTFWDFDRSPYVKEKRAFGHSIGRRHCYDMRKQVSNHWAGFFNTDRTLASTTRSDLNDFTVWLSEKGLAAKTKKNIVLAGTVALNWAFENRMITENPAQGLRKFSGQQTKRGVLTDAEITALFSREWRDKRAKIGNLLAFQTGLRVGEIAALQYQDIGKNLLHVRHSWSEKDRLKTPKNGEERRVPLLPELRKMLVELARENPHGTTPESFVFWSTVREDTPCDRKLFTDHLRAHLRAMEIPKDRGVVFHSWRHLYATRMADRLEARQVMLATGHRDAAVFEAYANHADQHTFDLVVETTAEVFGPLLKTVRAA